MISGRLISAVLLGLLLWTSPALADDSVAGLGSQGEVRVTADRMEAETDNNKVIFSGNVRATQNDIVIYTEKLTLYYVRGAAAEAGGIERAELEGDVRIVQQDRMATAERGLFLNKQRQVVLSGHAEVHQAGNVVKGDEIIYLLNEQRSIVKGTESRVKAVIKPKEVGR